MKRYSIIALMYLTSLILGVLTVERASAEEPLTTAGQRTNGTVLKQEKAGTERAKDPFLLPQGIHNLTTMTKDLLPNRIGKAEDIPTPSLEVKAILVGEGLRLASVDRHIVTVGDLIHDERVIEIQPDRVILGKGDKKRSLFLKQSPIRLTVEEKKRKREN